MTTLLWIAVAFTLLGGHGLLRGYSPTACKATVLAALGVIIACLAMIGGWWAWAINLVAMLACVLLAFHGEGQPSRPRRAKAPYAGGLRQATPRAKLPPHRRKHAPPDLRRGA